MNKFFNIKRTKMIDEAAFRHNPVTTGKGILSFILVYFLANILSSLIDFGVSFVYGIVYSIKSGLLTDYYNAVEAENQEEAERIINELMAGIDVPWWFIIVELFSTALIILVAIFFCKKFEKRPVSSMGIRRGGIVLEILLGAVLGAVISALTIGFAFITGSVSFVPDKMFSPVFVVLIFACLIEAAAEELLLRGYFMTSLARDTKPIVAILLSALVYALFHLLYLDPVIIINAFLFGVLMGLYVFKRGSIWGAIVLNFVWSYVSCVIFGSPILALGSTPSILSPVYNYADVISGGEIAGFEACLAFTLILVIGIAVLFLFKTKKREISDFDVEYFA